jgi:hypothetical protein
MVQKISISNHHSSKLKRLMNLKNSCAASFPNFRIQDPDFAEAISDSFLELQMHIAQC